MLSLLASPQFGAVVWFLSTSTAAVFIVRDVFACIRRRRRIGLNQEFARKEGLDVSLPAM